MVTERDIPMVIQPVWSRLLPPCEDLVRTLELRGWRILRAFGSLGVDRVRSHLASRGLQTAHEWWLWLDSDTIIDPASAEQMVATAREHDLEWLCAPVVCRGSLDVNIRPLTGPEINFGKHGGIVECMKGALACAVTHRRLFERMAAHLPEVDYSDDGDGARFRGWPFFWPLIRDRTHYGEDYSFALRARFDAGARIWCDTRVRVLHRGDADLGWEHAKGVQEKEVDGGG